MVTTQRHAATGLPKPLAASSRRASQGPCPAFRHRGGLPAASAGRGGRVRGATAPAAPEKGVCARSAVSPPKFGQNKAENGLSLRPPPDPPSATEGGREATRAAGRFLLRPAAPHPAPAAAGGGGPAAAAP